MGMVKSVSSGQRSRLHMIPLFPVSRFALVQWWASLLQIESYDSIPYSMVRSLAFVILTFVWLND